VQKERHWGVNFVLQTGSPITEGIFGRGNPVPAEPEGDARCLLASRYTDEIVISRSVFNWYRRDQDGTD
jgi:hypothetical protein